MSTPLPVLKPFSNSNYPHSTISSTTKVVIVRHGRTTYNEQGRYQGNSDQSVLTEKGYKTAYQTGLALQQFNFDGIYTSPLTRVQQTTQAIASALKQTTDNLPPILVEPKLTEINMSDWQGLYYQEVKDKFPEDYHCWKSTPHLFSHNRTFFPVRELFKQAKKFWQEILHKHRGQTILIVAHSGTNRALISTAIGLSPEHYHSLQQSNCGISYLEFPAPNNNFGELKYLNITTHLGEKLPKLKAGRTGWRWLLLSNSVTKKVMNSSSLLEFVNQDANNLILTDNTQRSESLALNILESTSKSVHLSMAQDRFLESWQKTIFTKQKSNNISDKASLVTGLIIASDKLISQILQKTLNTIAPLDTANNLAVVHYPSANRQSIIQGILPINQQLVSQFN